MICKKLPYLTVYKTLGSIRRVPISVGEPGKKLNTNIKRDGRNIMNIINDNTFNVHNSLLNNDNSYIKISLKFK